MEKRGLSLAEIQEVPRNNLFLLAGPPGAGKSEFCHQVVLNGLAMGKPVIFVTTEKGPAEIVGLLREKGMGEVPPGAVSFIDAFTETVGLRCSPRSDTVCANCVDLNSISIATTRLQEGIGRKGILLAFDSLTSPYLFSGAEVIKFTRLFLSKFAAEGNSVVALMDEGCGKSEDLVAMMSIADGVIRMEMEEDRRLLNVVKHPKVNPTRIEVPVPTSIGLREFNFDPSIVRQFLQAEMRGEEAWMRREVGDFVNLFWPNLAHWSGMLWDPKRFPTMIYEINKQEPCRMIREYWAYFPWRMKLARKLFIPKNVSKVKEMKKLSRLFEGKQWERNCIGEYLADISKKDEHYFRIYENYECCGFENIGTTIASHLTAEIAGQLNGFEEEVRDWNAIETKCIGLGDPYCEFKLVPREISELKSSLEKDVSVIEKIHERLMERLMGFLLHGKPLVERPKLGSEVHIHPVMHAMGFPHVAGERYRMAQRMGGARSGKIVGDRLMDAGLSEDDALERVIDFMNYCKVGKVTMGETIRIKENCESLRDKCFAIPTELSCFFTTGFLNGFFSAIKNQHIREIKCIVAGDPYCEWEIV
jgi:predicted hydrocarbon binding protein/KaiC/GvpD/RAD55 family RecA-like ATPase